MTMRIFRCRGGDPDEMAWIREHGLDPRMISPIIAIDDAGRVHLKQHRLRHGKVYVGADLDIASDPIVVTPKRPFPE